MFICTFFEKIENLLKSQEKFVINEKISINICGETFVYIDGAKMEGNIKYLNIKNKRF